MPDLASKDNIARGINALRWNSMGTALSMGLQFVVGIILARELGPEPFGLIAIAWLILGLGNLISEGGLGAALIQKQDIDPADIRETFTWQIAVGLLLFVLMTFSADLICEWFRKPEAKSVVLTMAMLFMLQSFGMTSSALLRRELRFKRLQATRILSYLVGYIGIGIPLAFSGYGVWSLVIAQLTQTGLFSLLCFLQIRHPVRLSVRPRASGLLRFGYTVTGSNLTSWAIINMDRLVIGRFFHTTQLGLYERAFNLLAMPVNALTSSFQAVLFAACSRHQEKTVAIRLTYVGASITIGLLVFPPFFAIVAIPETVLIGIYGEQWMSAVPLVTPLALAMPIHALLAMCGPVLTALGFAKKELVAQIFVLTIITIMLILAAGTENIEIVTWSVFIAYLLRFFFLMYPVCQVLNMNILMFFYLLLTPVFMASILAFGVWIVDWQFGSIDMGIVSRLFANIFVGGIFYIALMMLMRPLIVRGVMREALQAVGPQLPRAVRTWARIDL